MKAQILTNASSGVPRKHICCFNLPQVGVNKYSGTHSTLGFYIS